MKNKITAVLFLITVFILSVNTFMNISAGLDLEGRDDIREYTAGLDKAVTENAAQRNRFINLNGLFLKALDITYVKDAGDVDTYKLDNGQLSYTLPRQDVTGYADSMASLKEYLEISGNGNLIYVQLPFKIEDDESMPPGAREYGNENADDLLRLLDEKGVENMDMRSLMKQRNMNYSDMFFDTDHHWKPDTALWAAGEISSYLANHHGFGYDPQMYDIINYHVKEYSRWFLGSDGKRTGDAYAGTDDFELIVPMFETSFDFFAETYSGPVYRSGSFEDTMIVEDNLKKDYFNVNCYAAYIGGDYLINTVHNNMVKDGESILLLRDSFSCTMLPYLALSYENITAVDLRYADKGFLREYLDDNRFDTVIIAYNPSVFSEQMFDFECSD